MESLLYNECLFFWFVYILACNVFACGNCAKKWSYISGNDRFLCAIVVSLAKVSERGRTEKGERERERDRERERQEERKWENKNKIKREKAPDIDRQTDGERKK